MSEPRTADVPLGQVFTTEPQIMRALAAELRYNPELTSGLLGAVCSDSLGAMRRIRCESGAHENVDLLITFEHCTVGIEGKIGHEVTEEQIAREAATMKHLIVLVKDADDVNPDWLKEGVHLLTWTDVLGALPDTRVSMADVNAVRDGNRIARRALARMDVASLVPSDWRTQLRAGDRGYPSVVVTSPPLPDGRWIVVQVETDRGAPGDRFLGNIGVSVSADDFEESVTEPGWVPHARRLGRFLEKRLDGTAAQISVQQGRGREGYAAVKMKQAAKAQLPLHYAVGYTNSYLGVRTYKVGEAGLAELIQNLLPAVVDAFNHSVQQSDRS